jgi:hypothetical protein
MTPVNVFFILYLLVAPATVYEYDAKFETAEECLEMGELHMSGINGDVIAYDCRLTLES